MSRKTHPHVEGRILALAHLKYSRFMIQRELLESNIVVSESTASRVLRKAAKSTKKKSGRRSGPKKRKCPKTGKPNVIKRIKQFSCVDNPVVQKEMARRTMVSQPTVSCVINKKLDRKRIKKKTIKRLTDAMIPKRKQRAKKFAGMVSGEKEEFILTLDEAMLPLNFLNGQTSHSYQPRNISERSPNPPVATSSSQFPRTVMFAAGFTWRGQTNFYLVPEKTKMTGELFIEQVLAPMMLVDVPRLYGKDAKKVVLHMDSATSHTCVKTYQWLKDHKIKYITKDESLPNSPKISPMDYFANGYFKNRLSKRQFTTMKGMLAASKQEWSRIPLEMFQNALSSWSKRALAIHKARGNDVPQ